MKCIEKCRAIKSPCSEKNCRMWINYEEDLFLYENQLKGWT